MTEEERRRKREIRRRKRRNALIIKGVILAVLIIILAVAIWFIAGGAKKISNKATGRNPIGVTKEEDESEDSKKEKPINAQSAKPENIQILASENQRDAILAIASRQAAQYDYDGAVATLSAITDADKDAEIISMMADYETAKSNLVPFSPYEVTHVFFHSLVVDPARGFSLHDGDEGWNITTPGFCQWMTTVYEFDQMMEQMYARGYVVVALEDLYEIITDEEGTRHVSPKQVYLPQGKIPFVMSLDDLSYYHSYDGRGVASKMIVGEDGTPTCEYIDAAGNTLVGSYDCVPRLDDFIDLHPDFSYKGAKGIIALTGYNGVFGYRTDYCYRDRVELDMDQEAYLAAHPNFNWDEEVAQAKEVAQSLLDDGWTFATHTWGHIAIGDSPLDKLMVDADKWANFVAPIIGGSNTAIYAHGQDMASWYEEYDQTEKFHFMKGMGFDVFCCVDASEYFVMFGDTYMRMGRRNLDGYRLWQSLVDGYDLTGDLYDAATVVDPQRPLNSELYDLG